AAAAAHEEALGIFRRLGDRSGAAAAGQLLALARLDDPRVPSWIDDGLHLAEETGNPALERNALIVLAWFDFLRNRLGGPAATAEAEAHAARLARVSADLGDPVFEVQARCVAAILHRLGGRLDDAAEEIRRARHAAVVADTWSTRLLEAAGFVVAVARGEDVAIPQPSPSADPIALATSTSVAEA